jgi:hypothetical protein
MDWKPKFPEREIIVPTEDKRAAEKAEREANKEQAATERAEDKAAREQERALRKEQRPEADNTLPGDLETPTSNDVGKQTLTKADLGYDVTKEGTPPDAVAMESPRHPDDPSKDEDDERP